MPLKFIFFNNYLLNNKLNVQDFTEEKKKDLCGKEFRKSF